MWRIANDAGPDTSYAQIVAVGMCRWSEVTCAGLSSYYALTMFRTAGLATDGFKSTAFRDTERLRSVDVTALRVTVIGPACDAACRLDSG